MKYSRILIFVGIGTFVGFLLVFGADLQWGIFAKTENIYTNTKESKAQVKREMEIYQNRNQAPNQASNRASSNDNSDYYQVIIDNSLFRPLGWKPPNEEPEYTLLGTVIDSIGDNSQAFVVEKRTDQFYILTVGEKIGDAVVEEIEEKQITLYKNGEAITLNTGSMFLKSGDVSSRESSSSQNRRNDDRARGNNTRNRSKSTDINAERKRMEKMLKENEKRYIAVMKQTENAQKKMEQAKQKAAVTMEKKKVMAYDLELKMKSEGK